MRTWLKSLFLQAPEHDLQAELLAVHESRRADDARRVAEMKLLRGVYAARWARTVQTLRGAA